MRIVVFGGSGRIGRAVARDLAHDPAVTEVGLVGLFAHDLEATRDWIGTGNLSLHAVSVDDRAAMLRLMQGFDAGVLTLPDRHTSYKLAETAIVARLPIIDILEEYHRRPDRYETEGLELPPGVRLDEYGEWLHEEAVKHDVTFLDGMGLAPGLTNLTVGAAIRQLDRAESAVARVGGIPTRQAAANHPLSYMITWAFEHVLREYVIRVNVLRDGEVVEVEAGADRETFHFGELGRDEQLECAITPGMPSFLFTRPELRSFAEKTVRWPGHWQGIETLKQCGLLDLEPVAFEGASIVPRRFLSAILTPRLQPAPGESDTCVMYNTTVGEKDGHRVKIEHFMWEEGDPARGLSAMMRTTAFPAAIAARFLATERIEARGIVAPEDGITGALYAEFLAELEQRDITIREVTTRL